MFFLVGVAWPRGGDPPIAEDGGRPHSEQRRHRRRCCAPTRWARRSPTSHGQLSTLWVLAAVYGAATMLFDAPRSTEDRMSARTRLGGLAVLAIVAAGCAYAAYDGYVAAQRQNRSRSAWCGEPRSASRPDQRPPRRDCRATRRLHRQRRGRGDARRPRSRRQPWRSQGLGRQRRRRPRQHLRRRARRGADDRRQSDRDGRRQCRIRLAKSAIAQRRSRRRALLRASGWIRTTPISRLTSATLALKKAAYAEAEAGPTKEEREHRRRQARGGQSERGGGRRACRQGATTGAGGRRGQNSGRGTRRDRASGADGSHSRFRAGVPGSASRFARINLGDIAIGAASLP